MMGGLGVKTACAALGLGLAGCSPHNVGPDQAELATMREWNKVPRSSPTAFVTAFRSYCLGGRSGRAAIEPKLRKAGYVPLPNRSDPQRRAYVVDDTRPLVAIGPNVCIVRAKSRSGQTQKFRSFVAGNFPNARPLPPRSLSRNTEQAWRVTGTDSGIIATQRTSDGGGFLYSAIFFRESAQ